MTEMRSKYPDVHKHHFPCDCSDWHYIDISIDDVDSEWRFLEICDTWDPDGWKDRLKAAGKMLFGKKHYAGSIILDKQNTLDLKKVIDKLAKMYKEDEEK